MKTVLIFLLTIAIISQGCREKNAELNQFSSSMDTLLIRTTKQKGSGLFTLGVTPAHFRDTTESFPYPVAYPGNISDLKRMQLISDFRTETRNYVDIITGRIDKEQVIIVDENNNKDLRDDSVRVPQAIDWYSEEHLIPFKYSISNKQGIAEDSSWLRIGTLRKKLWSGRSEHLTANFRIGKEEYKLGMVDYRAGDFTYGESIELALLAHNTSVKDTLLESDNLKQGEILLLKDNNYRIENISYYGEYLTLIKVDDFDKLIGIQVGMIAPDFTCVSVAGDTIKSSELHDKVLVIANSCGCGGDERSTEAYFEILEGIGNKIHLLHLDSKIDRNLEGLHIDMEAGYNKDIYHKYRNMYCSRTCYVVGTNNRILDKFPVTDWDHHLPGVFK